MRRGAAQGPAGDRGAGRAAASRTLDLVLVDVWTYGTALMPEQYRAAGWAGATCGTGSDRRATRTRTRSAGLKFVVDLNTMELLEIEDAGADRPAPVMGEYVPESRARAGAARRPQAAGDHPARGRLLHLDGHELRWQRWSDAARVQLPRRSGHLPGAVRGPGHAPRIALPHVVRRDGGAVPGPDVRPLPAAPPTTSASGAWAS